MNFDQAIVAHSTWKRKLVLYIATPDHSLKVAEVGADNKCELGQWIAGDGSKYSSLPEFKTLREEHAHFHKAAADVIQKADSGQQLTTEDLGPRSKFGAASAAVVMAIATMKKKA
jgi:nitrogenase subunit NifH